MKPRRPVNKRKLIVDFGTDTGERAVQLARKNPSARVIGVDTYISPSVLAEKPLELKNLIFKKRNFDKPRIFRPQSIDVAEFNWSLEPWISGKALNNLMRWLKKDAEVRIRFDSNQWWSLGQQTIDFLKRNGFRVVYGKQHLNLKRPTNISGWEGQLREAVKESRKPPENFFYVFITARRGKIGHPINLRKR